VTDQDLIAALKDNKLHIDCVCMELTQNTESSPIRHTGLGYIFQDEGEIICFRMYVHRSQNFSMRAHLSQTFSGTPGTLYREERYYDNGDLGLCQGIAAGGGSAPKADSRS
jgi:hypothetical protein